MDKLLEKFNQLTPREQRLVMLSGVFVVIGIFYFLVWSPMTTSLDTSRQAVENKQADLRWVKDNAARAMMLKGSSAPRASFNGSLTQAVNQTANRLKISISRMQPQGDQLRVWVDQVPFNDMLSWLSSLENMGLVIINLDIAQADSPGQVKVRSLQIGKA